jgi:hypothetical protein
MGIGPVENQRAEVEFSWSWDPNSVGEAISATVDFFSKARADLEQNEQAYQEKLNRAHADPLTRLQADMFHRQHAEQEAQLFSIVARSKKIDRSKLFKAVVIFYHYDDGWHPSSKEGENLEQARLKSEK